MHSPIRHRFSRAAGLLLLVLLAAQSPPVRAMDLPPGHPAYELLERAELKGLLAEPLHGARPYSRRTVAGLLVELDGVREELAPLQRRRLDRYLWEFADDLRHGGSRRPELADSLVRARGLADLPRASCGERFPWAPLGLYRNARWIYATSGEEYLAAFVPHWELGAATADEPDASGTLLRNAPGFGVLAYYKGVGLRAVSRDAYFLGDTELVDTTRFPTRFVHEEMNRASGEYEYDESDALLSWQDRRAYLVFGRSTNRWGEGREGSLGLSGESLPYTQLRYRFDAGPLSVTGLHAKLQQHPLPVDTVEGVPTPRYVRKWMAGHRYQINISRALRLGLYDIVTYGDRGLDWDYLPPLTFLWSAEHYNRDRDNVQMGIDLRLLPGRAFALYGQWHLDELRFSDQFTDWWGNKHGYMAGVRKLDPLGLPGADIALEYVRLRPYIYTHKERWNVHQHYGLNLGYPLPPNSDQILLSWRQDLTASLTGLLELRRQRHGANPPGRNVGGDATTPHRQEDPEQAPFLDGDLETLYGASLTLDLELAHGLWLTGSVSTGLFETEPVSGPGVEETIWRGELSLLWHPWRWRRRS